jgi:large subunit ribosomal protein L29
MAKKKKKSLHDMSDAELREKDETLSREIFELRNTLSVQKKLEKPHLLKMKRKERARVLTLLTKQKTGVKA